MTDINNWLLAWFSKRGKVTGATCEDQLSVHYFNAGLIDSAGIFELIGDVENNFHICFCEQDFEDQRFVTIGGLAAIIAEHQAKGVSG